MIKSNRVTDAFKRELQALINKHSLENAVDMPDYMLANHLCDQISVLSNTLNNRDKWFSVDMWSEDKRLIDDKKGDGQLSMFDNRTEPYSGC